MKIDIGNQTHERRKKHYITPLLYMIAEIMLGWILLSFVMVDFRVSQWDLWAKLLLGVVGIYSSYKMIKIYQRQKNYRRKRFLI